jgi:hypothetical protein
VDGGALSGRPMTSHNKGPVNLVPDIIRGDRTTI